MRAFGYLILILISVLLQVAWGPWLSVWGFALPLNLVILLLGVKWMEAPTLLIFAFVAGLFYDLLTGSTLGLTALINTLVIGISFIFFRRRKS